MALKFISELYCVFVLNLFKDLRIIALLTCCILLFKSETCEWSEDKKSGNILKRVANCINLHDDNCWYCTLTNVIAKISYCQYEFYRKHLLVAARDYKTITMHMLFVQVLIHAFVCEQAEKILNVPPRF